MRDMLTAFVTQALATLSWHHNLHGCKGHRALPKITSLYEYLHTLYKSRKMVVPVASVLVVRRGHLKHAILGPFGQVLQRQRLYKEFASCVIEPRLDVQINDTWQRCKWSPCFWCHLSSVRCREVRRRKQSSGSPHFRRGHNGIPRFWTSIVITQPYGILLPSHLLQHAHRQFLHVA